MPGFEWFGDEERKEVNDVLDTGVLFRYEFAAERKGVYKVETFERRFASYMGVKRAQAVTSGTAALKTALAALGVGPGDEVITQGFTFIATFEAIIEAGAVPVPAEIDHTLNMDPVDLERKITDRTKAVIPVHMLGSPARIVEIMEIARRRNLKVIEDTAQALGASVASKKVGSFGDMGTFSFDFYKTITTGEGGMIVTDDETLYTRASEYADHGHDHNPAVSRALEGRSFLGFNYRMNELQGAVGLAQLAKVPAIIERQCANQAMLRETLENFPAIRLRELPPDAQDSHTHLCFFVEGSGKAKAFCEALSAKQIPAVFFKGNLWHYLPNWEHLIAQKTVWPGPHPFGGPLYGREFHYSPDMLPQTSEILDTLVVTPISLRMDEERIRATAMQLQAVAETVL
jgi:8-amino-3,8-dideoxy-alpha-D-manno-octulosonate transaminase